MLGRARLVLPAALLLFGCAEGGGLGGIDEGGSGVGGAASDGGGGFGQGPSSTTGPGPTAGGGGQGGTSEGGAAQGGGGAAPTCDFTAPEVCAGSEPLPAVAGDGGTPVVTRNGNTSKWFKIHIEEQDSSVFGADLSYTVSLASPPNAVYDLHVYQGDQNGPPNCNAPVKNGTGSPKSVHDSWGDDQGFGGEDDSVWLVIEVVHVSGEACGPGDLWTLQIAGDT